MFDLSQVHLTPACLETLHFASLSALTSSASKPCSCSIRRMASAFAMRFLPPKALTRASRASPLGSSQNQRRTQW